MTMFFCPFNAQGSNAQRANALTSGYATAIQVAIGGNEPKNTPENTSHFKVDYKEYHKHR